MELLSPTVDVWLRNDGLQWPSHIQTVCSFVPQLMIHLWRHIDTTTQEEKRSLSVKIREDLLYLRCILKLLWHWNLSHNTNKLESCTLSLHKVINHCLNINPFTSCDEHETPVYVKEQWAERGASLLVAYSQALMKLCFIFFIRMKHGRLLLFLIISTIAPKMCSFEAARQECCSNAAADFSSWKQIFLRYSFFTTLEISETINSTCWRLIAQRGAAMLSSYDSWK